MSSYHFVEQKSSSVKREFTKKKNDKTLAYDTLILFILSEGKAHL